MDDITREGREVGVETSTCPTCQSKLSPNREGNYDICATCYPTLAAARERANQSVPREAGTNMKETT